MKEELAPPKQVSFEMRRQKDNLEHLLPSSSRRDLACRTWNAFESNHRFMVRSQLDSTYRARQMPHNSEHKMLEDSPFVTLEPLSYHSEPSNRPPRERSKVLRYVNG